MTTARRHLPVPGASNRGGGGGGGGAVKGMGSILGRRCGCAAGATRRRAETASWGAAG